MQVAHKYSPDAATRMKLAEKIISGGLGSWGTKVMPPHPQHTLDQALQMVDWILSLATDRSEQQFLGSAGTFHAMGEPVDHRSAGGVLIVSASYDDDAYRDLPSVAGSDVHVLHARRRRAAYFDRLVGVDTVEVFEGQEGMVAYFRNGGYAILQDVNLRGIHSVKIRAAATSGRNTSMELRGERRERTIAGRRPTCRQRKQLPRLR